MRIFAASIGTETNTFAPIPTALESFHNAYHMAPGEHPDQPKLITAPLWIARRRAKAEGWTLIEGSCSWAEPAGTVGTRQLQHEPARPRLKSRHRIQRALNTRTRGIARKFRGHGHKIGGQNANRHWNDAH